MPCSPRGRLKGGAFFSPSLVGPFMEGGQKFAEIPFLAVCRSPCTSQLPAFPKAGGPFLAAGWTLGEFQIAANSPQLECKGVRAGAGVPALATP